MPLIAVDAIRRFGGDVWQILAAAVSLEFNRRQSCGLPCVKLAFLV